MLNALWGVVLKHVRDMLQVCMFVGFCFSTSHVQCKRQNGEALGLVFQIAQCGESSAAQGQLRHAAGVLAMAKARYARLSVNL
jgi:hypothetical protein